MVGVAFDTAVELPALVALKVSCAANDETPPERARSARSRDAFPDASGASGDPSREDTFEFAGTSPTPATLGVSPLSASPAPGDARWGLGVPTGAAKGPSKISPVSVLTVPALDLSVSFEDEDAADASLGASARFDLDRVSSSTPRASPIAARPSAGFGTPAGPSAGGFGFGPFDAPPTPARRRRLDAFDGGPGDHEEDDDAWDALSNDSADAATTTTTEPMETDERGDVPPPFSLDRAFDDDPDGLETATGRGTRAAAARRFPRRRSPRRDAPLRAPRLERADSLSQTKLLAQTGLHRSASLRADDGASERSEMREAREAAGVSNAFAFRDRFEFKSLLGKTPTSEAWAVRSKVSGARYCVKRVTEAFRSGAARARCLHEVQAVTNLPAHENVVKYHRAWQEDRHFFAQMELCERGSFGGCLDRLKRLREPSRARAESDAGQREGDASSPPPRGVTRLLAERDVWRFARDVALGLAHCHAHGVLHLDVKPDNVFVARDGVYKIGDFGVAWVAGRGWEVQDGDGGYVAPEMLNLYADDARASSTGAKRKNAAPTDRADVFSFGASVFEAACGARLPAEWRAGVPTWTDDAPPVGEAPEGPRAPAAKRRYWDGLRFPFGRSDELRAYVTMCLRRDPNHRPSAADLAKHAAMIEKVGFAGLERGDEE